jgi:hypothetical protein
VTEAVTAAAEVSAPEPSPETAVAEPDAAEAADEDVSLESILEDLKRREGRSE